MGVLVFAVDVGIPSSALEGGLTGFHSSDQIPSHDSVFFPYLGNGSLLVLMWYV